MQQTESFHTHWVVWKASQSESQRLYIHTVSQPGTPDGYRQLAATTGHKLPPNPSPDSLCLLVLQLTLPAPTNPRPPPAFLLCGVYALFAALLYTGCRNSTYIHPLNNNTLTPPLRRNIVTAAINDCFKEPAHGIHEQEWVSPCATGVMNLFNKQTLPQCPVGIYRPTSNFDKTNRRVINHTINQSGLTTHNICAPAFPLHHRRESK